MGGCDVVIGEKWIQTLGPITMDFRDVYMSFTKEDHTCTLKGI